MPVLMVAPLVYFYFLFLQGTMTQVGSQPYGVQPHQQVVTFAPAQNGQYTTLYTATGTPVQVVNAPTDDVSLEYNEWCCLVNIWSKKNSLDNQYNFATIYISSGLGLLQVNEVLGMV